MTSELSEWVIHVRSKNKAFIKSSLAPNKKILISGSFDADIVLRKLRDSNTKIQVSWVQAPKPASPASKKPEATPTTPELTLMPLEEYNAPAISNAAHNNNNMGGPAKDKKENKPEKPTRVPMVQIKTQSKNLTVDDQEYLKPYLIKNEITKITQDELTIIISTAEKFEAHLAAATAKPASQAAKTDAEKSPEQNAETEEVSSNDIENPENPSHKHSGKAERSDSETSSDKDDKQDAQNADKKKRIKQKSKSKHAGALKERFQKVKSKIPPIHPAVTISGVAASVLLVGAVGYFIYDFTSSKHVPQNRQLMAKTVTPTSTPSKTKSRDITNYFYEILAYYPQLHLNIDFTPKGAVISGYSADSSQSERFMRALKNDLDIAVEFRIHSLETLSQNINQKLSKTAAGEVSLVYVEKDKLTCISSAFDSDEHPKIERSINESAQTLGYPNEITCTKILFSKDEISFVSNTDYPFVKLKNGNVFFKDSEISRGIFLTGIDNEKLTFKFRDTTFFLTLK